VNRFVNRRTSHGNVVLNFQGDAVNDLSAFAEGYRSAARILAQQLASSGGYADYEGYPIVFLYRHALELYLKAIVYRGAAVLGLADAEHIETTTLFHNHKLIRLLKPLRAIFQHMGWMFDGTSLSSFGDFEALVRDIEDLDSDSFAFRYPVTRNGDAAVGQHYTVDVLFLAEELDPVLQLLEGGTNHLHELFQALAEAKYEIQEFLRSEVSSRGDS
jgi:hypothetical protein